MDGKVFAVQHQFDVSKICRVCLSEKNDMRSVFVVDESLGQAIRIAEMIMDFTSVQIDSGDGMPSLVCLQCIHQVNRTYSFKQLCEQSDANLRQYLGKPPNPKSCKQDGESVSATDLYSSTLLLDSFNHDDSSNDSDDSFKEDLALLDTTIGTTIDPNDEKLIAQKQLLKAAKMQKNKSSRKRLLAKYGANKAMALKILKRNTNQCNVCKKQFINLKSFRKHLRTHIEDRPFKCKLCPRGFTEENYLNNHMRTHMPDEQKPHECKICKKRFIHATLLNKHLLKHTGEKPFVCKICNKGCYAENSLLKHMKIHLKKEGDPGLLKHICDYCKVEYPDAQSLDIHIKQHTGDRPFLCKMCGKSFPQRFNLELHLRTHTGERPFTCEICKNGYVSKASLKIHMRTHTNERPFVCDFCGKAFRQSGDLTSHKRLHGTEKPIECSVCQKRFTTVMKLKYHMRNHTGERPYVCSVCGRGFTVNTILLRHMRVHSGERPYVCVTCGKAFSQSSTLNTHMKVHASSPKYNTQETSQQQQPRMPKFPSSNNEIKYHPTPEQQQQQQQQQNARLMHPPEQHMHQMQPEPQQRMMQQTDGSRMQLSTDGNMLVTTDNRVMMGDGSRLIINIGEPPKFMVNSGQLQQNDGSRMLATNMGGDGRNLAVIEGSRMLGDKYLVNYDPYHRGHL